MPTRRQDRKSKAASEDRCGVFVVDAKRVQRGRSALLADEVNADIAGTFKVLAHPTRVRIIQALAAGELCVCELSEVLGLSVSATSHQLHLLRNLHLVRARSEGKLVHYSLSDPFVLALLEDCTRHVQGEVTKR
ncbi:MAG TPA: metalloregulator ArsR/SmtB family transcription factor [Rhodoglobus sp.]|nr:metalloregulator ArsR/SmtB family transcription factor [Rhodoglobus sp.]